ncbi:hypothetical protein SpCBS45565_g06666 [Spizellomyces sp. 'palustris']|nr:hypothetical protein SpCBS45565_g06666 [Spizellomyces sp. 'palustris']
MHHQRMLTRLFGRRLTHRKPPQYGSIRFVTSTVDQAEIAKFARAADDWWNPGGEFAMLHRMNPARVGYVRDMLEHVGKGDGTSAAKPFTGLRLLDIGCGGGLLSEALVRLGATVVGADAAAENIHMARIHAAQDPALQLGRGSLEYRHTTAEQLAEDGEKFDAVCALEIIEHVVDAQEFIRVCSQLVKPNGLIFCSTISRTPTSYLFTILLAEHLLRWVPPGTHEHAKYVTPEEMQRFLTGARCELLDIKGMSFNPVSNQWSLLSGRGLGDLQMNYIVSARKMEAEEQGRPDPVDSSEGQEGTR